MTTYFFQNISAMYYTVYFRCVLYSSLHLIAHAHSLPYIYFGAWAFLRLLFSNYRVEVNHGPKLEHLTELSEYNMCVIYFKLYIPYMCSLSIILNELHKG